jgi:hypothetical protein
MHKPECESCSVRRGVNLGDLRCAWPIDRRFIIAPGVQGFVLDSPAPLSTGFSSPAHPVSLMMPSTRNLRLPGQSPLTRPPLPTSNGPTTSALRSPGPAFYELSARAPSWTFITKRVLRRWPSVPNVLRLGGKLQYFGSLAHCQSFLPLAIKKLRFARARPFIFHILQIRFILTYTDSSLFIIHSVFRC